MLLTGERRCPPRSSKKETVLLLSWAVAVLYLAGCSVGPKYSRPATLADKAGGFVQSDGGRASVEEIDRMDGWWRRFGDPATSNLVEQALENNYDVKIAAARVAEASAVMKEVAGQQWPQADYQLVRNRNRRSFDFGGGRFAALTTSFTQDINVSYVLDLFGKLRHARKAALAELMSQETSRVALTNSVIASVIKARIEVATGQRRLEISKANTESWRQTVEIVERRYKHGLTGPVDVRLAREGLAEAQAVELEARLALTKAGYGLDVLLGRAPGGSLPPEESLAELPDLKPAPVGIPAQLLARRPDVMSSELKLRAANEQVGVAVAGLLPDITLSGSYGRSASRWSDLWIIETETYSAIAQVTQPIFQGGRLRARVKAEKARYEQALNDYGASVLTAIKEVEESRATEQMLSEQLAHTRTRLAEAREAENLSQTRYSRGVEAILTVLESQRRRNAAEDAMNELKDRIWTTRVNLMLALGGDWAKARIKEGD